MTDKLTAALGSCCTLYAPQNQILFDLNVFFFSWF